MTSKTRKKSITAASPMQLENRLISAYMAATPLSAKPPTALASQRSQSAFGSVPSASDLLRVFTESASSKPKKTKRTSGQSGADHNFGVTTRRPSRRDEIVRALKAQAQNNNTSSGYESPVSRILARAQEKGSDNEEQTLSAPKSSSRKRTSSAGGAKTFSAIIRSPEEASKLGSGLNNTQSSEFIKGSSGGGKKKILKKKKASKSKENYKSAEYLAAAEIEDLLGMPLPIQNQIKAVQRELKRKEKDSLSRTNLSEELDRVLRRRPNPEDTPPESDDIFFPPPISPKHDDYPILDDEKREETSMNAMKYVHNALALWAVSHENSEAGTPTTVEQSVEEADLTRTVDADGKVPSTPGTPASCGDSESPPRSPSTESSQPKLNKQRNPKGKSVKKKVKSSQGELNASAAEDSTATPPCPGTPEFDENGNHPPKESLQKTEKCNEDEAKIVGVTASTQTIFIGSTICTQTGTSMTELISSEESSSREPMEGQGTNSVPEDEDSTVNVACTGDADQSLTQTICKSEVLDPQKSSRSCVGTCDGPVVQRSTEMSAADIGDENNNIPQQTSTHRVTFSEMPKVEEEEEPTEENIPVGDSFGYLDEPVQEVGSSCGKTTSESQATDSLYGERTKDLDSNNNNSGDHPHKAVGEVKCYEQDSQQTVACQPPSPSVHTVGVSGVAKTWSLTAYNHPTRSLPIKQLTALQKGLGYSASTQTIDESNAECQVGRSFTNFAHTGTDGPEKITGIGEEASEEQEPWDDDDDDPRMHVADEVLDSEKLLEMSEQIVQKINDLDIGTNIEKISNTISSTVRAVTEIITDLVITDDNLPRGCPCHSVVTMSRGKEEDCCKILIPDLQEALREVEREALYEEGKYPAEYYPETGLSIDQRPCAALDPTLSATSL